MMIFGGGGPACGVASRGVRGRSRLRTRPVSEVLEGRQLLATITVNSAGDAGGLDGSDTLSLRQAIQISNGTLAIGSLSGAQAALVEGPLAVPNSIVFAISGSGPHTISPASALPAITGPVTIDGYSQTGSQPNTNGPRQGKNAILRIELDGTQAGPGTSGLDLEAASTVRGLAIGGFGVGLTLHDDLEFATSLVEGNFIGTDANGSRAVPNGAGIEVKPSFFGLRGLHTIGGTAAGAGNVISGNVGTGLTVGFGNLVQGNFVGTDASGSRPLPNGGDGINFFSGDSNTVGGTAAGAGNLISGNAGTGLTVGSSNVIQGNFIGVDVTGTLAIPNGGEGIRVASSSNTVGGTAAGAGNVISGNAGTGLLIQLPAYLVQGNLIGTDLTGTGPVPNGGGGIVVALPPGFQGVSFNLPGTIGGASGGAGNVISGNAGNGLTIADSCLVLGNFIGTDPTGTIAVPNGGTGLRALGNLNTIGGTAVGAGNVISNNVGSGISIPFIAGTPFGPSNNQISGNSIYANGSLGIDLGGDGITPNNPAGSPTGPNRLQPYPVITSTPFVRAGALISATLDALPSTSYTVEFFATPVADPSGFGQGRFFLGSSAATTDAAGHVAFTFSTLARPIGQFISATATDPQGNTSEFARDLPAGIFPTTTTLVAPNPVTAAGRPITFAAVVASTAAGVATGRVDFLDGGVVIGSATPDASGVATFVTSGLAVGPHVISAAYQGDPAFGPSRSEAATVTVSTSLAPTFTSLTGPGQVVRLGRPTTLSAFVGSAVGVPFGPVEFLVDGAVFGRGILDASGVATFVTSGLTPGPHVISASFAGDPTHGPSRSASQAVSVFAPRAFGGPAVTSTVFVGPRSVRIAFNRGLSPGPAQDAANYAIVGPRAIAVLSAEYDPATDSVTLTTRQKLDPGRSYQLTINGRRAGRVVDVFGIPLNGKHDGRPGRNYSGKIVIGKGAMTQGAHPSGPKALAKAHRNAP